ncbi:MAG TPA: outer membrane beta-barrel protein [Gemmataceae bacterium]|jgi:hypothetical protein|nr:outer membrane beta-barrel protein [Gemmataceae bacterium]
MLHALVLGAALALGQTSPYSQEPPEDQATLTLVGAAEQAAAAAAPEKEKEPIQISAPLLPAPTPPAAPAAAAAAVAPPPRWALMKELQGTWPGAMLDENRMQVTGWIDSSFTASSTDDSNLPLEFNHRANQFLMQQAWVRLARSVVTTGTSEPTYGFQSDWIFGSDYRFTLSRGVFNEQLIEKNGLPTLYGVDPVQFYGEAYYPTIGRGLDVKVGRFYTPFGVESIEAVSSPFLSHSYTFNFGPFTHTGVLATLTMTPVWTAQAGIVAGEDIILFNTSDSPTVIGTIQWTQPQGTQSVSRNIVKFTSILGTGDFDIGGAQSNFNLFDVVWTHNCNPVLAINLEANYTWMRNVPDQTASDGSTVHIDKTNWESLASYVALTLSARLVAQARFELFNDPQGVRTSSFTVPGGPPTVTDAKGLYEAITVGLIWTPRINKSIIIRPELRYDHNDESTPFEGHHGLFTAATDVILRY